MQERDHHAFGQPDAARQRLLQRDRPGLVGQGKHQACGCEHRRWAQLAHGAAGRPGSAQGAHPIQHRLGVGRQTRHSAKPGHRQHRLRAAQDQSVACCSGHPVDLPPERHPVLEGRRKRRSVQRTRLLTRPAMRSLNILAAALISSAAWAQPTPWHDIGRDATPAEVKARAIDVRPDFKGLPNGAGTGHQGEQVWEAQCASCHGSFGESNEVFTPIVGGTTKVDIERGRVKNLEAGTTFPQKTTMMKVATVSTLWDYINRAMPWNAPKSLKPDEVYSLTAYILSLADVVPPDFKLSNENIAEVQKRMPNRNGMVFHEPLWKLGGKGDVKNVACMKDCPVEVTIRSSLPDFARDA